MEKSGGKSKSTLQMNDEHNTDGEDGGFEANNENWIPNNAYNLAHNFREQHGDELTFELVNDLLRDLNKIYRERERKQTVRVKQQATEEVNKLKRKLVFRPGFDEVTAKKNR